ncbi:tubulin polyglutamylase complex subunit 2-like [Styela clava]|uniref:tubulin polyglutamylase complex subunit 2-like n=1 Tax=Styela clava TaxID=7725 RepID=UPI00193A2C77|nr:tubulin polyglutamylase complex subunit 2-like [Styela clava]
MVEVGEVQKPALSDLLERLTLGVSTSLEKRLGVCDVSLNGGNPAERHQIVAWEQRNACILPEDLKNFYLTTDGLLLTWSVLLEDNKFPVGRMEINPFSNLVKISSSASTATITNTPSFADIESCSSDEDDSEDSESDNDENTHTKKRTIKPHFDGRSRIFELENCQGHGKVCLVYLNTSPGLPAHKPEIWFLDRSLMWHFLSKDFTSYYRLMLMHLGLPQWHFALTDIGLSLQAQQWFNMYAPVRLKLDQQYLLGTDLEETKQDDKDFTNTPSCKIDFARLFKGKLAEKPKPKQLQPPTPSKKKGQPSFSSATSTKSTVSSRIGRSTKPWT